MKLFPWGHGQADRDGTPFEKNIPPSYEPVQGAPELDLAVQRIACGKCPGCGDRWSDNVYVYCLHCRKAGEHV